MVRVISQETYNEAVQENINEFSMSPEEAIEDAINQFKAQGIDLSNIIKDLAISDVVNKLSICLKKIDDCVKVKEYETICVLLEDMKTILDKDMAHKVYAGKNGGYSALIHVLKNCMEEPTVIKSALSTILTLMTGNPDLLDNDGISFQITMLEKTSDTEILLKLLKWIRECCIKQEINRKRLFNAHIIDKLKIVLTQDYVPDPVIKEVCILLRAFTLDDDIRHEFGSAHEYSTAIARNFLSTLTSLLSKSQSDVAGEIMLTLACAIVRNEFCEKFKDANGMQYLLDVMTNYPDVEKLNWQALKLLKALAGNDNVKAHIVASGSVPLIVSTISRLRTSESIVTAGLACIAALTLRSPSNAEAFYECGTASIIVDIVKMHVSSITVIQQATRAIRNMSVRNKDKIQEFIINGVEDLLANAASIHKDIIESDIKAALRDLELKVDLQEQWTGKGISMSN